MLMNDHVKEPNDIPAVSHFDQSARVQVVSDERHITYKIMTCLDLIDSCPVLANTSLNQKDEPLINSALRCVHLMNDYEQIGAIYLGDCLIVR